MMNTSPQQESGTGGSRWSRLRGRVARILVERRLPVALLVLAALAAAIHGASQLRYDDDYRRVFQSDHPVYQRYQALSSAFSLDENDFIVIAQSDDVLSRDNILRLREVYWGLNELEGVGAVFSIFDVRSRREQDGYLPPLFPSPDAGDGELEEARQAALSHPMLRGVLLSEAGDAALFIATYDGGESSVDAMSTTYADIRELAAAQSSPNLTFGVTGIPALRVEIIRANQRDQVLFLSIGAVLATLLALLVFRRIAAVVVCGAGPALGITLTLGVMGYAGDSLNVVNSIVPIMLLVIGYADSVHLVSHIRDARTRGLSPAQASLEAVEVVGPACALTSFTTLIAFLALGVFGGADIIKNLGYACAAGTVLLFLSVIVTVPLLTAGRMGERLAAPRRRFLDDGLARLHDFIRRRHRVIAPASVMLVLGLAAVCTALKIDYVYVEHIPDNNPAHRALTAATEKFGGMIPARVLVQWPEDEDLLSAPGRRVLRQVHTVLERAGPVEAPASVLNVWRSLPENWSDTDKRDALAAMDPDRLARLMAPDARYATVSAYVPDRGAAALKPVFDDIDRDLDAIEAANAGFDLELTGLLVTTARMSRATIQELTVGLGLAAAVIFVVMGLALRSARLGLLGVLPNVFPLIATAAALAITGIPLQYTSVLAFTICIGIAADDTAHYIVRFQSKHRETGDIETALEQTTNEVGAALVITTVILVAGLAVLLLSALPNLRIFGGAATAAIVFALVGDLLFLPALILRYYRVKER